jgi:simple sugar transport system permease protein
MYRAAFGDADAFADTLVQAIPLILTGLAVAVAFSAKLWNIGAEGQFFAGAIGATGVALACGGSLGIFTIPAMMLGGMAAGALWALIPAVLRAYLDVNEIISTLMLNYIIALLADYLIYGPWRDPHGFNFPLTATFDEAAWLPTFGDTRVHFGLIFGLVAALVVGVTLTKTVWGYELKVMGDSLTAARYAGVQIGRNILLAFAFSGALAGLAGMGEVSGIDHKLQQGISPGYGFTAIIVAWLARLNVWGIVLVAVLFGGLVNSGYAMKSMGISSGFVTLIQGTVLFFVLAGEALLRKFYYRQDLKKILMG